MHALTALVTDSAYFEHETGRHPENAGRLRAVYDYLRQTGLDTRLPSVAPRPASDDELLAVHTLDHLALIAGLAATLPGVLYRGLSHFGLPASVAHGIAGTPPIGVLFAAFLGYNPMKSLVPASVAQHLSAHAQSVLFGKEFFPHLILPAFMNGLHAAFYVSAALAFIAAIASLLRGKRYIHEQEEQAA